MTELSHTFRISGSQTAEEGGFPYPVPDLRRLFFVISFRILALCRRFMLSFLL